jgi:repressor LexA|tara:strand:- start:253 stop:927 length:675 start_codon:yes stop_codon:yes gene_type:complete
MFLIWIEFLGVSMYSQMGDLSSRQQKILQFLIEFMDDNQYPPSVREIQDGCDISSTSVVDYNLRRLEEKGYIHRGKEISRSISLESNQSKRTIPVPILGKIAAGVPLPMPSESDVWSSDQEMLELTEDQTQGKKVFALMVEGTSMIDALINDGDIVVLEPTSSCDNGEMVAVWLKSENETTLKKFFHEGEKIRLQPMNATMSPIYVDPANIEIQGRVVTAIRSM